MEEEARIRHLPATYNASLAPSIHFLSIFPQTKDDGLFILSLTAAISKILVWFASNFNKPNMTKATLTFSTSVF